VGAGGGAVGLWRGCLSAYRQHYDLVMYLLASFFLNEASSIIYRLVRFVHHLQALGMRS
jgi:hypothetical protein